MVKPDYLFTIIFPLSRIRKKRKDIQELYTRNVYKINIRTLLKIITNKSQHMFHCYNLLPVAFSVFPCAIKV